MKRIIIFLAIVVLLAVAAALFFRGHGEGVALFKSADAKTEKEIPLFELFEAGKMERHIRKMQNSRRPAKIRLIGKMQNSRKHEIIKKEENEPDARRGFIRPEETGEDFSAFEVEKLLEKLNSGDRIEQRKAANALWDRYGASPSKLTDAEKGAIAEAVARYLGGMKTDFEESFMQLQRLWHLAAPALLANVTAEDASVSENAARLLSVMKTERIIEGLIAESDKAKGRTELEKCIFALEYMKINNRYFLKGRSRMSDDECRKFYESRAVPQIAVLRTRLEKEAQAPK